MTWRAETVALCSAAVLGAAAGLPACADEPTPLTQIIVVVDTDLQMPVEIDMVSISVTGALNMPPVETSPSSAKLPLTLGLVHGSGPLGPVMVTVQGSLAGNAVVDHAAEVSFKAGKTLQLALPLLRACEELGSVCSSGQTCSSGECVARALETLPEFAGVAGASASGSGGSSTAAGHSGSAADSGTPLTQPPVCTIAAPADGSHFVVGELVRFSGSCVDPKGERVYPRWRSDLNGLLSVYDIAIESDLAVGMHTITFCGYDASDVVVYGCATLTVTIDPA